MQSWAMLYGPGLHCIELRWRGLERVPYLWIDFHVVSEADIVDDAVSQLMSVKGRQRAQTAIHSDILRRKHLIVLRSHFIRHLRQTNAVSVALIAICLTCAL